MKNIIATLIIIVILCFGLVSAYDYINSFEEDTPTVEVEDTPTVDVEDTPTEESKDVISIFNNKYSYQGYLNYDSTVMSGICDTYLREDVIDDFIIEKGVDLKIMSEEIVSELGSESCDSCVIFIYFPESYDSSDLKLEFYGLDDICFLSSSNEHGVQVRALEKHIINVSDFVKEVSMIRITINDYSRLVEKGAYIKQL